MPVCGLLDRRFYVSQPTLLIDSHHLINVMEGWIVLRLGMPARRACRAVVAPFIQQRGSFLPQNKWELGRNHGSGIAGDDPYSVVLCRSVRWC